MAPAVARARHCSVDPGRTQYLVVVVVVVPVVVVVVVVRFRSGLLLGRSLGPWRDLAACLDSEGRCIMIANFSDGSVFQLLHAAT